MWKKARTLRRGSFGLVSLAISQPNDESKLNLPSLMAVKSAETFQHHSLQKESNLLTELNDYPNILRCCGSFISNDDDNNSVEPIRNFCAALFLANIGMLIHVHFLWNHIDILLAAVILVIVIKTLVVATVVKGFRYNNKTSLLVGMSLAQIGEFAFVLLSRASNVHLDEGKLYLLLLGTTALSLAIFIPSAEALDTSYFMSNYVWNPDDENVGGGSDFDDMTETCRISCCSGSCYTQDEDNVGEISDLSGKARLFLVLPVALLDAFFILWIFTFLSATLNKLQVRHMLAKLDIYRKFTNALAVAVIVSVGWICYELYFKSTDVYNEQWQNAWIIPAFWQVLSFSLLCVICALWAPSQNSMRYTYSGEASEEFDRDDNTLTLIKPSPMPSKDIRSPLEVGSVHGGSNGLSNGDLEEDKTE